MLVSWFFSRPCSSGMSSPPVFFLYFCVHHRDLHSFPTRRSSDLSPAATRPGDTAVPRPRLVSRPRAASERSEEHTSELQSLRHVVCRLLLEKKNGVAGGVGVPTRNKGST